MYIVIFLLANANRDYICGTIRLIIDARMRASRV